MLEQLLAGLHSLRSRLSRETTVQAAPSAATGTQAPPPPPLVGEFGSCCSSPCCSCCCPGWRRREAAAPVPSRVLHFCSCFVASLALGTPLPSLRDLTPGAASRPVRAPPRGAQAQRIPPRPAGLAARCAWGSAAFGEATPLSGAHPHTAPSLHPDDSRDASSPPPRRPQLSHPTFSTSSSPPTPPSFLYSASPPPQWVSRPRGRPCTLIGAGES
nr:PREDICTED: proline-rich receptor-like protein kinase PERK9 [Equus przewalskii]XP_008529573.1 PREDICTED: proline-rich receptor-like protein kinase PERK9 [Equus przewalskii]XP_008529579.1 PREDICTED: proline-rich receptor-like protein kinase PERK9 [Equus przewalskii]XP_008529585.1 PREDICTED: proline-rich receptor-like protein kinase PERK9 [Equus przewalskii]